MRRGFDSCQQLLLMAARKVFVDIHFARLGGSAGSAFVRCRLVGLCHLYFADLAYWLGTGLPSRSKEFDSPNPLHLSKHEEKLWIPLIY